MRVTPTEFARQLTPQDAREMLEALIETMPRGPVLEVLANALDSDDFAQLANSRLQ